MCRDERERIVMEEDDFGYESPVSDILSYDGDADHKWSTPIRESNTLTDQDGRCTGLISYKIVYKLIQKYNSYIQLNLWMS